VRRWEARDEPFREGTMSVNDHIAQRRLLVRSEKECQTLVEVALILVLIAVVSLVAIGAIGLAVSGQLDSITAAITHVE
jgi:Flp pilus assembly pilin Flp